MTFWKDKSTLSYFAFDWDLIMCKNVNDVEKLSDEFKFK